MGLGVAIGGAIGALTIFVMILTYPMVSDSIFEITTARLDISQINDELDKSYFIIDSFNASSGSDNFTFVISEIGNAKLRDFEEFGFFITYHADVLGTKTTLTEKLTYNSSEIFTVEPLPVVFLRPDEDLEKGLWDDIIGGDSDGNLYDEVDEETRNDIDFISSDPLEFNQIDSLRLGFNGTYDPLTTDGHKIRYTYKKDASGGNEVDLTIRLYQGTNQVASWFHNNISDTFSEVTRILSFEQVSSITNYGDLNIGFNATCDSCDNSVPERRSAQISWIEYEVPGGDRIVGDLDASQWSIVQIKNDNQDPGMINSGESAIGFAKLSYPLYEEGILRIVLVTEKGSTGSNVISEVCGVNQFARPDGDVSVGTWIDTVGGDSDGSLYDEIDEEDRSDLDFARSGDLSISGSDTWEASLSDLGDPRSSSDHDVRYSFRKTVGADVVDLDIRLLEGTKEIASWSETGIVTSWTETTQTLSALQADSIENYDDLRLEFTAICLLCVLPNSVEISWAELEIPRCYGGN